MKLVKLFNPDDIPKEIRIELVDALQGRSSDTALPWQTGPGSEAYAKRMREEYPEDADDSQIGYWDLYESCNYVVDDWLLAQGIKPKEVVFFVWDNISLWEKL